MAGFHQQSEKMLCGVLRITLETRASSDSQALAQSVAPRWGANAVRPHVGVLRVDLVGAPRNVSSQAGGQAGSQANRPASQSVVCRGAAIGRGAVVTAAVNRSRHEPIRHGWPGRCSPASGRGSGTGSRSRSCPSRWSLTSCL